MSRTTNPSVLQYQTRKHFRYRKVTPDLLEFMKQLRTYQLNYRQIAEICELNPTSVQYHLDLRTRERTVARANCHNQRVDSRKNTAEKQAKARQRRWMKEYLRERYHNDPEFRARVIRANMGGRFAD
jgi:hypothetical protein